MVNVSMSVGWVGPQHAGLTKMLPPFSATSDAPSVPGVVGSWVKSTLLRVSRGTNCWHCGLATPWNSYVLPLGKVTVTLGAFVGTTQYVGKGPLRLVTCEF